MPIFEYECRKCGESFEKLVKNQSETVQCVKCGGQVERLLSSCSAQTGAKCPVSKAPDCGSCCAAGKCDMA